MIMQVIAGVMLLIIGLAMVRSIKEVGIMDFLDVILVLLILTSAAVIAVYGVSILHKAAEVQSYVN